MDFENKIDRLEKIVGQMEDGDLSLEDSLKLFEEGVKLSRECQVQLSEAEQKVKLLISVGADGQMQTKEFKAESL